MKHIAISILDYNGKEETLACLKSLDELNVSGIALSVVIVDNYPQAVFSVDGKKYKNFEPIIFKTKENLGFAGGHNVGIKKCLDLGAEAVLILNNDTRVDPNLLQELLKVWQDEKKVGAIIPKIYFEKGNEYHKEKYRKDELGKVIWYAGGHIDWSNVYGVHEGVDEVDNGQFEVTKQTDLMTGCCVLIPKDVLERVKGFDNRYFLYFEDADLNQRIKMSGYSIWFAPKAILWHINAASTGGSGSTLQDYFFSRNRLLFGMQYAPMRTKIALLRESVRLLRNGREWQKKGIVDYFRRRFGKGSYPR